MTPYLIQKKVLVGGMLNFTKPGGPVHLDIPSQESESDACRYGNHRAARGKIPNRMTVAMTRAAFNARL